MSPTVSFLGRRVASLRLRRSSTCWSGLWPPSVPRPLRVRCRVRDRLIGAVPLLAGDDVRRVPRGPVVLRSGRLVLAVVLLRLPQQLRQGLDVGQRTERKVARISSVKSSGSSHAAKWPPLSTLLK